jgi:predicted ribonuclease YlaK
LAPIEEKKLEIYNDTKILACAIEYERKNCPDKMIFVTNDLALTALACIYFGQDSIERVEEPQDDYTGYKDITFYGDSMEKLYSNLDKNLYNLNILCYNSFRFFNNKTMIKRSKYKLTLREEQMVRLF